MHRFDSLTLISPAVINSEGGTKADQFRDEQVKDLQQEFHSLAREALRETGRRHYLELTRDLCRQTGRVPAFDAD